MSEYREALQKITGCLEGVCNRVIDLGTGVSLGIDFHALKLAVNEAKALLARGEPEHDPALTRNDLPQNLNRIAADIEYCARKVNPAHEVHGLLIGAASALIWLRDESLEPAAAEKAREPMHEGFPVDTIVRDIFTDKVGTIVSYHCRFEVEWADGSKSMDVHCRQLDHCGPLPSPPAATGE